VVCITRTGDVRPETHSTARGACGNYSFVVSVQSKLLEIVGQLHEGAVDEALWRTGIGNICKMMDIPGMLVGSISEGGRNVEFEFSNRLATEAVAILQGPLADPEFNPWLRLSYQFPLRRVATVDDLGGQAYLETTRVWRDFYLPLGFIDAVGTPLERQPECAQVLVAGRLKGMAPFTAQHAHALEQALPHIARAWRVRKAVVELEQLTGTLKAALDGIERAVIVAGPEGDLRYANHAADRLLGRGGALDTDKGKLRAGHSRHTQALRQLVLQAAKTATGTGSVAVDALALPRTDETPPLAVVAEPLAPAHSDRLGHSRHAGAILYIGDSQASRCPAAERLACVYGLTPAEARLSVQIVKGDSVIEAAKATGMAVNTAKHHLKQVYGKVGVVRQSQLVRRVMADVGGLAEPDKLKPRPAAAG